MSNFSRRLQETCTLKAELVCNGCLAKLTKTEEISTTLLRGAEVSETVIALDRVRMQLIASAEDRGWRTVPHPNGGEVPLVQCGTCRDKPVVP